MIELITETATTRSFADLTESVVEGRLSSAIYAAAKEIYPLRRIEVAKLELDAHPAEVAAEEEAAVDVEAAPAE
jgi:small subunit ribosomal protein S3Ae